MATKRRRMTFAVTPDMEELMDEAKKMFYDSARSEMIRKLGAAGLEARKAEKEAKQNGRSA